MLVFSKSKNFSAKDAVKKMKEKQQTGRKYWQNRYDKRHKK